MAQTVILESLVRIPVDDMCGFEVECTRGTRGGTGQHVGAGAARHAVRSTEAFCAANEQSGDVKIV